MKKRLWLSTITKAVSVSYPLVDDIPKKSCHIDSKNAWYPGLLWLSKLPAISDKVSFWNNNFETLVHSFVEEGMLARETGGASWYGKNLIIYIIIICSRILYYAYFKSTGQPDFWIINGRQVVYWLYIVCNYNTYSNYSITLEQFFPILHRIFFMSMNNTSFSPSFTIITPPKTNSLGGRGRPWYSQQYGRRS